MDTDALQKLTISPEIEKDPALRSAVLRATDRLVDELGESAGEVAAEWRLVRDHQDRRILELQLTDFTGSVGTAFASGELDDDWHLRRRLYRLWGELLQRRSHRQLERLHEVVQALGDE